MGLVHTAARRILRTRVGISADGGPRMKNEDTGQRWHGYVTVNQFATTPFSRTVSSKGYVDGASDITDGSLVRDLGDDRYYLVMSSKNEIDQGRAVYKDLTLYWASARLVIQRPDKDARDAFGMPIDSWTNVALGVRAMMLPTDLKQVTYEEKRGHATILELAVQRGTDINFQDRIITEDNRAFVVTTVDLDSLPGLIQLTAEADSR